MIIKRSTNNPILKPDRNNFWEAEAAFNGCPVIKDGKVFLLYRALSLPHYHHSAHMKMMASCIGIAESKDGVQFSNRRKFIVPEESWERFGCEDPRVTKLNGRYYVFYTALSEYPFRADGIKIGLAISKDLKTVASKHLVTPFNAKAMALFPEKISGKIWAALTVNTDKPPAHICLVNFDSEDELWSEKKWQKWYQNFEKYSLKLQREPRDHIELGSPPIKTKKGWLLIYSHIRNYFGGERLFGIEAVLLDLANPLKVLARTEMPILTPDEYYERIGLVPNIVFPSGALLNPAKSLKGLRHGADDSVTTKGDWIYFYYGAADTTCCLAFVELGSLLEQMLEKEKRMVRLVRAKENPIILPKSENSWESKAVFNPAAVYLEGKVHIVYRAMSENNTSVMGYASSRDGINIDERLPEPIYIPREPFEEKRNPGGFSGCEDPRLTQIGNRIHMLYTAYNGQEPPRVALTSISVKEFLAKEWNWAKPVVISPSDFDNKDALLFPEKFNGNYIFIHRVGTDVDFALRPSLDFQAGDWLEEHRWLFKRKGWWDSKKLGAAAPPIKTKEGWIMLYHGVSDNGVYRVGAVLLDSKNPLKIIGRTDNPILEPEMTYEKEGQVRNVVFPCGTVLLGKTLFVYYGGGDQVIGVATVDINKLIRALKLCKC